MWSGAAATPAPGWTPRPKVIEPETTWVSADTTRQVAE